MANVTDGRYLDDRHRHAARAQRPGTSAGRALTLATISFALSFAAWGLVGGLASTFTGLYALTASQTALLVAVPVLLGSLARLPMGMLTDRFGGRLVFSALLAFSSLAALVVPLTASYQWLLIAAFLIGMAGSSFSVGAAFVSRWTPADRQGTALGIYGLGTMGQSLAVFVGPVVATRYGWEAVFQGTGALLLVWAVVYFAFARNPPHAARPASVAAMTAVLRRAHGVAARSVLFPDVRRFHILPLLLLFAISVSGLMLTASYTWMRGYAYEFLAILHAVTVILTLLWLPFGKLFHVFQRPAQLGVGFYKDAGARGQQASCRRCAQPFASMPMVRDLTTVERELGFRYELPNGGHYQEVCPKCRRALFGLAQGALWRQYLNARDEPEGG
jgi:MFS family permease